MASLTTNIQHADTSKATAHLLTLVLDEHTDVAMSDRPIFGTTVTIRDDIESLIGSVLQAGLIVGWLNYVDVTKFACITDDKHYQEASHYFKAESNQLVLVKPLMLHDVDTLMSRTKQLFTFSNPNANVSSIKQA
jgi:hypothetical protein